MDEEQSLGTAKEVRHAVVDVEGLVKSLEERLKSISESPPPFRICRVPATIRKDNEVYYNPKIVSIGPFHRQSENLQVMEEHKWRCLHKVRGHCTSKPDLLEECVEELMKIEENARQCYSEKINMVPDDEFVKMMLLDGFFIIQLIFFEIEGNDPILRNYWMFPAIIHDMLLLENQLPFCVLECLAKCIGHDADALKTKASQFFSYFLSDTLNFEKSAKIETLRSEAIYHLLHLVHWFLKLVPSPPEKPFCAQRLQEVMNILSLQSLWCLANNMCENKSSSQVDTIPTATELEEAGVVFKRNEEGSLLDVTFKNGVMRLPRLQITDNTNSLFRNIIAFEQCFPDSRGVFTSYCFFMDSLVNTPRDVQILKQSDIIENLLGSDKEVALLFNQLCKEIAGDFGEDSVGKACKDVKAYAATRWHKWRARLMRDYFSNPWAIISLIAAVYVIFLTSVSTYYAAF